MKAEIRKVFTSFAWELIIYGVMVTGYFFLVLHFLGDTLFQLFQKERHLYAALAVALIIVQGIVLEMLTRALLGLIGGKKKK